jgi:hypothetical protein
MESAFRGEVVSVYINQANRDGVVLSVVNDRALVEYAMPRGRTFLLILNVVDGGYLDVDSARSVSWNAIPKKFLDEMRANKSEVSKILYGGFSAAEATLRPFRAERFSAVAARNRATILQEGGL